MIKPEIITITSPDLHDLEQDQPEDPHAFCILVQVLIGLENEAGGEVFYFTVCTPKALEESIPEETGLSGWSYILLKKYDYKAIERTIQSFCDQSKHAEDWDGFAENMKKFSKWEFDGH